jgi:hypothetical protein
VVGFTTLYLAFIIRNLNSNQSDKLVHMNLILNTKSVHHVIGENSNDIFVSLFLKTILIFLCL